MIPRLWISKLTFSDGTELDLSKSDIVIIVGPNNAGKSDLLRSIQAMLMSYAYRSPVVSQMSLEKEGTREDLLLWLNQFFKKPGSLEHDDYFEIFGSGMSSAGTNPWDSSETALSILSLFFCRLVTAGERLQVANPAQNIAITSESPTHPIHYLLQDDRLEKKLSEQFRKAFDVDLIVHRNAGSQVPLYAGTRPPLAPGQDRLSYEYIQALEKLPMLQDQGDGMRSFAGVLLSILIGRESILLIDEPEAFLHPSHARQVGRMLTGDKSVDDKTLDDKTLDRQLFVATHSGDVLRGVLDADSPNVRVVRICRAGNVNTVSQLDNTNIVELWTDPLLRHSNILDGLFHEKVIVTESDSDARFYAAVMDAVIELKGFDSHRPDVMFTHCGGKDRLATVVRALRRVNVPVVVVADFDVLSDEHPLKDIVEATNGKWMSIQRDWQQVKNAIASKKAELSTTEVVKEINDILKGVTEVSFPNAAKQAIKRVFQRSSPWAAAKENGKNFVPSGEPMQAYERLSSSLRQLGIFIVEVGELECFVRTVGNHGPKWTNEVLKKNLASDPELETARSFVSSLLEYSGSI